jgi:hypothetical protein
MSFNGPVFIYTDDSHEMICDTVCSEHGRDTRRVTLILAHHMGLHVTETVLRTSVMLSPAFIQN